MFQEPNIGVRKFNPMEAWRPALWSPGYVFSDVSGCDVETNATHISIKVVVSGEEHYEAGGRHISLRTGNAAIVGSHSKVACGVSSERRARAFSIFLPWESLDGLPPNVQNESSKLIEHLDLEALGIGRDIETIDSWRANPPFPDEILIMTNHIACRISSYLLDLFDAAKHVPAKSLRTRQSHATRLLMARQFLIDTAMGKVSVETVANKHGFTRFQFARAFKLAFGVSPQFFRDEQRLRLAQRLIRSQTHSFVEIAEMLDFGDYATFSKAFSRKFGVSPRQFSRN